MSDRLNTPEHPEGLTDMQEELSSKLFEIGAIKFGDFRLKLHNEHPEAPLSPIYVNLRVLRRYPEAKTIAVNTYQELIDDLKFDLLADIPTAATPLVSSLSDRIGIGMITPRTDSKGYGTGAKIDGFTEKDRGRVALLIDDLITKADSKLEAVEILRQNGLIVRDVVVLIDRGQGGGQELAERGLTLHAAITMPKMLDYYTRVGRIGIGERAKINQGLENMNAFLESLK